MKGTRPLNNNEIRRVFAAFTGTFEICNSALFMLGVSTGGRISELLSLTLGDVYQDGAAVTDLRYSKSIVKGDEFSRAVPVNSDGRRAIEDLIGWHGKHYQNTNKLGSSLKVATHESTSTGGAFRALCSAVWIA